MTKGESTAQSFWEEGRREGGRQGGGGERGGGEGEGPGKRREGVGRAL